MVEMQVSEHYVGDFFRMNTNFAQRGGDVTRVLDAVNIPFLWIQPVAISGVYHC